MLEPTKELPTDEMVTLHLHVHKSHAERIEQFVRSLDAEAKSELRPWREVLQVLRPQDSVPSAILRGSRNKEELTQVQLSEMTGIPRRHLSEMEHGKRAIGKETARKLAKALQCDYRVFL
jgi:DNA-binding XRE family transcriptional regulator